MLRWPGLAPAHVCPKPIRAPFAAYMAGWDAVSELAALAAPGDATQPNKLQFDAIRLKLKDVPEYWTQVGGGLRAAARSPGFPLRPASDPGRRHLLHPFTGPAHLERHERDVCTASRQPCRPPAGREPRRQAPAPGHCKSARGPGGARCGLCSTKVSRHTLPVASATLRRTTRTQVDASKMVWLRARLLLALYDYVASKDVPSKSQAWREVRRTAVAQAFLFLPRQPCLLTASARLQQTRVADANATMLAAVETVATREAAYRVPVERIAGWRNGSTAYRFGYLWTAHSLYYWWYVGACRACLHCQHGHASFLFWCQRFPSFLFLPAHQARLRQGPHHQSRDAQPVLPQHPKPD